MDPASLSHLSPKRRALYADVEAPGDWDLIFENAEKVADAYWRDPVLDYLYEHAREPKLKRNDWTRQAHVASSIEFLLEDFFGGKAPPNIESMFDPTARAEAVRAMTSPRGVLAMTFHGGFAVLLRFFFNRFLDQSFIIDNKTRPKFRSVGAGNPGAALFGGLRALGEGRAVYVAPDGENGRHTGEIQVLGANFPVTDGAPFLAYETGCQTVCFHMRRDGRIFVPVAEPGPARAPEENFKDFRARLFEFYQDRIEDHFTGDPHSLCLSKAWRGKLRQAMEEGQ